MFDSSLSRPGWCFFWLHLLGRCAESPTNYFPPHFCAFPRNIAVTLVFSFCVFPAFLISDFQYLLQNNMTIESIVMFDWFLISWWNLGNINVNLLIYFPFTYEKYKKSSEKGTWWSYSSDVGVVFPFFEMQSNRYY